jgi:hypothetical protein
VSAEVVPSVHVHTFRKYLLEVKDFERVLRADQSGVNLKYWWICLVEAPDVEFFKGFMQIRVELSNIVILLLSHELNGKSK